MIDLSQEKKQHILVFDHKTVIMSMVEDHNIDAEDILGIDIHNIIGELLTFPIAFNRVGVLKGEIENLYSRKKMETDITIANLNKKHKEKLIEGGKKHTLADVESEVMNDPEYKQAKLDLFSVKAQADMLDSFYWSCKSKDKKLDALSAKIKPEDYENEIMEGICNQVMIKLKENLI